MTPGPQSTAANLLAHLKTLRNDDNVEAMARFAIATETALGISNPTLQKIARQIGKNHTRALELWRSGMRDARMLAIYTADPSQMTRLDVQAWAADFNSWEIVDAAADLLTELSGWQELVAQFAQDDREFVRRAAFAMIAGACVHNKSEPDATFLGFLPLMERHAGDPRNFVRKSVNWALRNIGKRNPACHGPALTCAERLAENDDKTARWIGRDALKELTSERVLARLRKNAPV
ncbi:DNA alkylation repair protein [Rhizobium sp. 18065]|uniref:DNA alkylation repair protein n=1 Tax=Rhizobium sp. 18065 TaxID=2681411 RepID=UPI00135AE9F7|nr:DNA alkylation repair protein [Rhizobium sp. 18065]